jgi:arsenate reductase
MTTVDLWLRRGCSKCERAEALLAELPVEVRTRDLAETPPTRAELEAVLRALELRPSDLARRKEPLFVELGLAARSEAEVLDALVANPALVERPIALRLEGGRLRAALGRPPVRVLEVLAPTLDSLDALVRTIAGAGSTGR